METIARMSPVRQSRITQEPDSSPMRRAVYSCRSASMANWTVLPLLSGFGSSSRISLPRAVTSTRWPPGSPQVRLQRPFKTFLADFNAGTRRSGFLPSFSYSVTEAAPTYPTSCPTADPAG